MNILIIEDDIILAEHIWKVFRLSWRFNNIKLLHSYSEFRKNYHMIDSYDIVLIDILLSKNYYDKHNWIELVKLIRFKNNKIPIIVISWLNDIKWLDLAFSNWANDYLVKPFRLKELEIRVESWFRTFLYNKLENQKEISYYSLKKDLYTWEFFFNDKKINLTKNAKFILSLFLKEPEKLITDLVLKNKLWWDISSIIERNPRVNILRLKNSLKPIWIENWIINIRWEWYMLIKN